MLVQEELSLTTFLDKQWLMMTDEYISGNLAHKTNVYCSFSRLLTLLTVFICLKIPTSSIDNFRKLD